MESVFLKSFAMLAFGINLSSGIVLQCDFKYHESYWGTNYACIAKYLETTIDNRTITEVKGDHIGDKTNDDVEKFLVNNEKCPVLPLNIGKFFKNLEVFYVMKSDVKTLTNEDLKGLDKLNIFDVSYNPIERIENGYFEGKSSIKIISFFQCSLKFVASSALDPLINLEEGHFEYNHCIDYRGDHKHLLPTLKRHLLNCGGTRNNIDLYPTHPDLDDKEEENGKFEEPQSSTESKSNEVHYINECQHTFVGRNAFFIILLLVLVIIVGIISFGCVQYRKKSLNPLRSETHRLTDEF